MAFAISIPTSSLSHSSSSPKPFLYPSSNSSVSILKNKRETSELGFAHSSQWNGLKQLRFSISNRSIKMGKRGKRKGKGKGAYASLFGVGAPEALVIGVVALLVFGPKGLAEVARNLGKTLRAFQPTIRELQDVSREFKSSLEREIGLDQTDYRLPPSSTSYKDSKTTKSIDSPTETGAYTADEYLKVTEAQLKGALSHLQAQQEGEKENAENQFQSQTPSQDTSQEAEKPGGAGVEEGASGVNPKTDA